MVTTVNGIEPSMVQWDAQTTRTYLQLGRQAHVETIRPVLCEWLNDLSGRSVMDFGCGPGHLAIEMARWGADEVICIDQSPQMIDAARRQAQGLAHQLRARMSFRVGGGNLLPTQQRFDVVLCSLVLMMCRRRTQLHRLVAGLIGSLAPAGRLIIVLTHPCFRTTAYQTFHYQLDVDFDYWKAGAPYEVVLNPQDKPATAELVDYHWPLEDYAGAVMQGGGVISRLRELPATLDDDGHPQGPPAYLLIQVQPRQPMHMPGG